VAPHAWVFTDGALGKPTLGPSHPLRFSVAHVEGLVVCAVAWNWEVGVDVEPFSRGASLLRHVERVLSPAERQSAGTEGAPRLEERLLSTWVLKEALLKGLGVGLTVSPEEVSLDLGPAGPSITHAPPGGDGWQLALLDLEGHRIGLAAAPGPERLELQVRTLPVSTRTPRASPRRRSSSPR
jgi:4'-phosphopantetheinyl transferase